jgi:butyryl-CoA dehydrogenase
MQVLGGAGYTDDFPLEQYYRDIRVNAIYEGTTGIHGMDLLGRKIFLAEGKAMTLLMKEVKSAINQGHSFPELAPYADMLAQRAAALHQTTMKLIQLATTETPEVFLADATLYLEFMGHLVAGWVGMEQGIAAVKGLANSPNGADASFYMGKIQTLRYFYEYELPKTLALEARLNSTVRVTLETKPEFLH